MIGELVKLLNRLLDWFSDLSKKPDSILFRHRKARQKAEDEKDTSELEDNLRDLLSFRRVCERTASAALCFRS